jgi:hypothetical protein
LGKDNCAEFKTELASAGLTTVYLEKPGRIRENLTLHSLDQPETRISFSGFPADDSLLEEVAALMEVDSDTVITFTGRVASGMSMEKVKAFLKALRAKGAKIVLDSKSFTLEDIFEVVGFVDDRPISKTPVYLLNQEEQLTLPYSGLPQFTLDEALNYPDLDAVLVEVPNNDLAEIALCCMKKGLPMHVDKPGGEDPVLFKKLIDGCKAAAIPLQMGYMYRCNPAMNFCRKLVQGDILGDILEIEMDMSTTMAANAISIIWQASMVE